MPVAIIESAANLVVNFQPFIRWNPSASMASDIDIVLLGTKRSEQSWSVKAYTGRVQCAAQCACSKLDNG